jgi:hypothetical protein
MSTSNKNIIQEPQPDYEKAEMDLLRAALKRSYTERNRSKDKIDVEYLEKLQKLRDEDGLT